MIIATDKKTLRKNAQQIRNNFADNGMLLLKSAQIVHKILNSLDFKISNNIAIYFPIKNEIDLTGLLNIANKSFYLPKCVENNLEFVKFSGYNNLEIGKYNIIEPIGSSINPQLLDIIYIPALMANSNNYRLGYGKGYYDRFFANNKVKAKKIIVVAKELYSNDFVQDVFDFKCDSTISA